MPARCGGGRRRRTRRAGHGIPYVVRRPPSRRSTRVPPPRGATRRGPPDAAARGPRSYRRRDSSRGRRPSGRRQGSASARAARFDDVLHRREVGDGVSDRLPLGSVDRGRQRVDRRRLRTPLPISHATGVPDLDPWQTCPPRRPSRGVQAPRDSRVTITSPRVTTSERDLPPCSAGCQGGQVTGPDPVGTRADDPIGGPRG